MLSMYATLQVLRMTLTERLREDRGDRGATAVEYGLIVALIAAIIIAVITFLGQDIRDAFNDVEDGINGNQGG